MRSRNRNSRAISPWYRGGERHQSLETTNSEGLMFGTLLESRARRHRRTGGAALSIAAHVAIIGVTTAATMHGTAAPRTPVKPEFVVFKATPAPKPLERRSEHGSPVVVTHGGAGADHSGDLPADDGAAIASRHRLVERESRPISSRSDGSRRRPLVAALAAPSVSQTARRAINGVFARF